ncbi:uncharacterized protein LOC104869591 [Fukomys damarensis]|uniref:uncharacterized protein LOC104869591 n=1 Tax=Fukomys damarensis TaxID=885580 RepID=UPI00053F521C|nr:uncharacterized protein LOC104869591 [Fukomys damarensis]
MPKSQSSSVVEEGLQPGVFGPAQTYALPASLEGCGGLTSPDPAHGGTRRKPAGCGRSGSCGLPLASASGSSHQGLSHVSLSLGTRHNFLICSDRTQTPSSNPFPPNLPTNDPIRQAHTVADSAPHAPPQKPTRSDACSPGTSLFTDVGRDGHAGLRKPPEAKGGVQRPEQQFVSHGIQRGWSGGVSLSSKAVSATPAHLCLWHLSCPRTNIKAAPLEKQRHRGQARALQSCKPGSVSEPSPVLCYPAEPHSLQAAGILCCLLCSSRTIDTTSVNWE